MPEDGEGAVFNLSEMMANENNDDFMDFESETIDL
jgi:hypothetical protein